MGRGRLGRDERRREELSGPGARFAEGTKREGDPAEAAAGGRGEINSKMFLIGSVSGVGAVPSLTAIAV